MIDFLEVQDSVKELKKQLTGGQIDEKSFEDHLLEMIDIAEDGYYWMYGHESEKWFRHDGKKWLPDDPAKVMTLRSEANAASAGHSATEPNTESGEHPVNAGWLVTGIAIISAIGWIVYSSSLG